MEHPFIYFLNGLEAIIGSPQLLFFAFAISFCLKFGLVTRLIHRTSRAPSTPRPLYFLILVLISALICDIAWLFTPFKSLLDYRIYNTFLRISWASTIVLYQSMALFIESLASKNSTLKLRQKVFICCSSTIFLYYFTILIFDFNCLAYADKSWIEKSLSPIATVYMLFPLIFSSIYATIRALKKNNIPHILSNQIKILIVGVILPLWLSDFVQTVSMFISPLEDWINNSYTFASLSTMLLTYAVFYSIRKIMCLRFLNLKNRIQSPVNLNFMNNLKVILERLSRVTNQQELVVITQGFFKEAFNVPFSKISITIRTAPAGEHKAPVVSSANQTTTFIETFLNTHSKSICKELFEQKIIIYDEITFSNFYEQNEARRILIQFMESINADIFLPIYEKENLIAYIVVERFARPHNTFYSEAEHDEMLIFASYLGNVINLLKNQDLDNLIEQEKSLNEELYRKHQEINQYKESIRSFLRSAHQKAIGIVFYKNRQFTFGNQAAKEIVKINLNMHQGHPTARAFKTVAQHVEEYKSPQSQTTYDADGNMIVLSAVPNLEGSNIIITVSYPDIADILKKQIDKLHDPSERDYLLYLETTKSGKLINQLIPGSGELFLNFKIELLKTALSKKATLLSMPEQDLQPTVELLHHISLREKLHTVTLSGPSKNFDVAIKLFGINPIFGLTHQERPLLENLHETGTLFIKNIHYLDRETQKYLAELIRYGFYKTFRGEQKEPCNVRIICSSDQNLSQMVQDGQFCSELFNQLKEASLVMPPLASLSEEEINALAEGFSEQALKTSTFKSLLALTTKDKYALVHHRPASLFELKEKIMEMLKNKSEQHEMYEETMFNPAFGIHNPELAQAQRLGKQALKNKEIMILLWSTFKNQNQIATFLGVNRSSVNRRCKAYNLIE